MGLSRWVEQGPGMGYSKLLALRSKLWKTWETEATGFPNRSKNQEWQWQGRSLQLYISKDFPVNRLVKTRIALYDPHPGGLQRCSSQMLLHELNYGIEGEPIAISTLWLTQAGHYPHLFYLVAQLVKNSPAVWETWVWSLGWEDVLEKRKATHSSIVAWRILWTA